MVTQGHAARDAVQHVERLIADMAGRRFAVLTGSGTTAIAMACELIPPDRNRVVIPAITCAQVLYAVRYAGREPVLADVRDRDATIDPAFVATLLERDPSIGGVIAVHTYGHAADMDALRELARRHDVLLIEDAAQAQGGSFASGRAYGSAGDIAVMSFGHTKILDAGGGGAVLFDREDWLQSCAIRTSSLPRKAAENELRELHSRLYYEIWAACRSDPRFAALFDRFAELFQDLFMFGVSPQQAKRIAATLPALEAELRQRRRLFEAYRAQLAGQAGVRLFDVDVNFIAPWRFSFRVAAAVRDKLLDALRSAGHHASAWYPCLTAWSPEARFAGAPQVPTAEALQAEIVNVWVDGTVTEADAQDASAIVRRTLSEGEHPQ